MTEQTIAQIAAKLRIADQAAVIGGKDGLTGPVATLLTLAMTGMADFHRDGRLFLTERGLAVRAHLLSEGHDHDRG